MKNTVPNVIFEPTEADYEFVDALVDGLNASFRVPSADEVAAQLEDAEHFDSMQAYFESLPDGGVAGRVLGWLPSRSVNLC